MLVVMMLMTASSAMAQEAKFEVIDGFRYLLDTGAKTAMLLPQKDVKYSGDIIIPEKVKSNDGVEYDVTSLGDGCFGSCSAYNPFVCYFAGRTLLRLLYLEPYN